MHFNDKVSIMTGCDARNGVRLGIELEYEGAPGALMHVEIPGWNITPDTSLRNGGIEFVSMITIPEHVEARLAHVHKLIKKYDLQPHKRCGVHVHVNMTDCTIKQLWCVSTMYCLLEPYIFAHFAPERMDNHFCVPITYCETMLSAFDRDSKYLRNQEAGIKSPRSISSGLNLGFTPEGNMVGSLNAIKSCAKYAAVNYRCLHKLGTLEFRHLGATTELNKVKDWCDFLVDLRKEALKYADPQDILDDFYQRGAEGILADVGLFEKNINQEDKEDAEYFASVVCGAAPLKAEQLTWKIGA